MKKRNWLRGALIIAVIMVGLPLPGAATNLPPGFIEQLVADGLPAPTSMTWDPEGTMWLGGKEGHVWRLRDGQLVEVIRLAVSIEGERGIHSIAIDPDFLENRHVWIYYTTTGPQVRNRLARFRSIGDQLVDETLLFETPDLQGEFHHGGCVRFTPDGTLFLSTGDDLQNSSTSQNPDDVRGKILHLNRDGTPAAGNPYLNGGGDPRVWAIGFRNPWRFSLQPESNNLFIGDVGDERFEELNIGVVGGNFGWAIVEGPEPAGVSGVTYPIYAYAHTSENGHAIIAGGHAVATDFPEEYSGDFFFADAVTNEIFRMVLDPLNQPASIDIFASETSGAPVDLRFGPDGALYYVAFATGQVFRITFTGGDNRQPIATATVAPDNGEAPLTVTLNGAASSDPDGDALSYSWDLGNGNHVSGAVVTTTYAAGAYRARLTVTDTGGAARTTPDLWIVSGNTRPTPVIEQPAKNYRYTEGELIPFSGTALDLEGGLIPCERMVWTVIFHHKGHAHPFLGPIQGCSGLFVVNSHGVDRTFYEITVRADDRGIPVHAADGARGSDGGLENTGVLSGTQSIFLFPDDWVPGECCGPIGPPVKPLGLHHRPTVPAADTPPPRCY